MNNIIDSNKKNILITGVTGDIGKNILENIVTRYPESNIFGIFLRSENIANELRKKYPSIQLFSVDCTNELAVSNFISRITSEFFSLDVLINCIGTDLVKPFLDTSFYEWKKTLSENLDTTYLLNRYVLESMMQNKRGLIINISSMWGENPASCEIGYSVAKAGVNALTKGLAKEFGASGIRVNAIAPGFIYSKMNEQFLNSAEDMKEIYKNIPLAKPGSTQDISNAVLWLMEDNYTTGQIITIDGGWNI